jgi:hypothetical protein
VALAVQRPFHPYRPGRTAISLLAPQHPVILLAIPLNEGNIAIKTRQFPSSGFPLGRDKEPMQLLFKGCEVYDWRLGALALL